MNILLHPREWNLSEVGSWIANEGSIYIYYIYIYIYIYRERKRERERESVLVSQDTNNTKSNCLNKAIQ